MEAKPGVVVAGCYELLHELARGGMGSVWAAHHRKLDEQVAIKFMDRELALNPDARARFEREAKAAAKLRSPHVVQILDYGVDDDVPFIVMELLEGQDLRSRLKQRGRLSLSEAQEILVQGCKALRLAADAGIVHRDIKPGNIFLARSGDDEVVKILDFGVAKAVRRPIGPNTSSNMLLGSPHYMSPEQARAGGTLDHRGDLWSMAVILFQMITGRKPFTGSELGDVIVKICTEPAPPVTMLVPALPEAIDHFFDRALAKDPNARFQSARALASEFSAIVSRIDGVPTAPISLPEERSRPELPSHSFPSDSWRETPPSIPSVSDALPVDSVPAAHGGGTLTVATRSLPLSQRQRGPRIAVALALVAVLAVVGFVVLREPQREARPVAAGSSEPEAGPSATSSSSTERADAPPSAGPVESATAHTMPAPAPSSSASSRGAATRPIPRPAGSGEPKHTVLGF